MTELLVATPLTHFTVALPYTFSDGITIREISPILWDIAAVKGFISESERQELTNARYWLCASKETDAAPYGSEGNELYAKAEHAMSALQIICPSGAKNVYLKFHRTHQGYDNVGIYHPKQLCNTLLGRITSAEKQQLERDFNTVFAGVRRAFSEKVIRLQNPIILMQHAQQIGTVEFGMLMCVMGLDMLFMAGEKTPFIERLGGFLGPQCRIFPPDSILNRQPVVTVQDVIADLYEFRNKIAHGQEVPESPYRQKYDLLDESGLRINHRDYYYAELMVESALFMLAAALRKLFVEKLFDDVLDASKWRNTLRLYEHRWRNSAPAKGRQ